MPQGEIRVDPERLSALASSLALAHATIEASPRYARLEAGDREGRLRDAVTDFIVKNEGPREDMRMQLKQAADAVAATARSFAETESCLVQALTGGGS